MAEYVIADTSCLILFEKIGELKLLKRVYGEITITPEVLKEYGGKTPAWIIQKTVKNIDKQKELEHLVDKGEASVIALTLELKDTLLIIDDKRGRKLAGEYNLALTGTLGTLLRAKRMGIIPRIKPVIEKLTDTNFRISTEIIEGILKRAGE